MHWGRTRETALTLAQTREAAAPSGAGARAFDIEILADFAAAEADWRRMERLCVISPYQSFGFCRAWMQTIGAAQGLFPLIAIARVNGELAALLPLAKSRFGPLRCAAFQGGRMANYQMGLFRKPETWTRSDVDGLLRSVARRAGLDLFLFAQQPITWRGHPNPLAEIGGPPSPSFAYATRLGLDYSAWLAAHYSADARKKRRAKTRKLQALGAVLRHRAETFAERRDAFEALFAQKCARMAALGLPNEFEDPAVAAFIARLSDAEGAEIGFEWHVTRVGDRIVSVYGGLERDGRLSGLLFSHDMSMDVAPASPGEFLVLALAEHGVARGLEAIDYGVGEARYKTESCEIVEEMFDTAFAANVMGMAGAVAFQLARRVKRRVKQNPRLFDAARWAQRVSAPRKG